MEKRYIITVLLLAIFLLPLTAQPETDSAKKSKSKMDEAESLFIRSIIYQDSNPAKAFELVSKAAGMGYLRAQDYLAYMYENGIGTTRNYSEAIKWYTRASESGYTASQYTLGYMYEKGEGVPVSFSKALHYYKLAANKNYPYAKYQMASMYEDGRGVAKDYNFAQSLYKDAAEDDYYNAQLALGKMYMNGKGIPKNNVLALKWFIIAAERYGIYDAVLCRRDLIKNMSSEEISEAENLAFEWMQKRTPTDFQITNKK